MVTLPSQNQIASILPWLKRASRIIGRYMPAGLYPRSLIIVIAPMVLLQAILVMIFMERHWETVTKQLSGAVTRDIALLVEIYENDPFDDNHAKLIDMARDRMEMAVSILKDEELPTNQPRAFFRLLDNTLTKELTNRIGKPFWIDTLGKSGFVEIRIKVEGGIFRVIARRSRAYASNSEIFILWMVGSSLVLLTVAIIFLRNQIRPIQRLAKAAEAFGLGRDVGNFRPSGATEVQRAARAFIRMRERIERQIVQRTTMLAGVSHDLRTLLTRFKLQLAFLGDTPEVAALERDVKEMQHMVEDYLAFARGDGDEAPVEVSLKELFADLRKGPAPEGVAIEFQIDSGLTLGVRPIAFKRCIANLLQNACRFGTKVRVAAHRLGDKLVVSIDDNGPGIPADMRAEVFRPFLRLDNARNQDTGGSGLGLAIARDIALNHGGDIVLTQSELGGLKASVRIPL
ncbi:MAG: ATP-binding protein [Alphaproteobacteria bacterium]